jgi:hypothetical protein
MMQNKRNIIFSSQRIDSPWFWKYCLSDSLYVTKIFNIPVKNQKFSKTCKQVFMKTKVFAKTGISFFIKS